MGLINPSNGQIFIDKHELNQKNINDWKSKIGYVPQDVYLIDDSIRSNIALGIEGK